MSKMIIPQNTDADPFAYDRWLRQQWDKEGEGRIRALNASMSLEEFVADRERVIAENTKKQQEPEEESVDYQGLLKRVKALSASITSDANAEEKEKKKRAAAAAKEKALLDLPTMMFGSPRH